MATLKELSSAFAVLAPVFRESSHSLICGSSALAWNLAELGIEFPVEDVEDIDAAALCDDEFEQLVTRLGDLERAGLFRFENNCRSGGWTTLAGEPVRRSAGRVLLADAQPAWDGIAFELFDKRSRYIGSEVIGDASCGAGIVRLPVAPGLDLPFADVALLRRINDNILRESGCASGAVPVSVAKLDKRRRWIAMLDRVATEQGRRELSGAGLS